MKKGWLLLLLIFMACSPAKKNAANIPDIPGCIGQLIEKFQKESKQSPPRIIYSYKYKNKIVYYVTAICCDQFSDLYNDNCQLIGHPGGGFTGKGDGLFIDFNDKKSEEKLIWKDMR